MKIVLRITRCIILFALFAGFLSCANSELHVYSRENYINPAVLARFEKEHNCKVIVHTFDSLNVLYDVMRDESRTIKYDIAFPANNIAVRMFEGKLIHYIDLSKLPNSKHISRPVLKRFFDPNMRYSVPYALSYTGIAYNKNLVKDFRPSWAMFGRDDLAGKVGLIDDMRQVIGAALKLNLMAYNASDDNELKTLAPTLGKWGKNIGKIAGTKELEDALMKGELAVVQAYNGEAINMMRKNENIGFAIPDEGTAMNVSVFTIPRESDNVEQAYEFIDFFLEPENSKENTEYLAFSSVNPAGEKLLDDALSKNPLIYPHQQTILTSDYIIDLDNMGRYDELWRMVKQ